MREVELSTDRTSMLFFPERSLVIPLRRSPSAVIAALDGSLAPESWTNAFTAQLVGQAAEGRIFIRWTGGGRNQFRPVFRGRISDDGRSIQGAFQSSPISRGWLFVFLGLLAYFGLRGEVGSLLTEGLDFIHLLDLGLTLGMMVFAAFLPRIGWRMGREDRAQIEAALHAAAAVY